MGFLLWGDLIGLGLVVVNFLLHWLLGALVLRKVLPVFVTRKIIHITFYTIPFLLRANLDRSLMAGFAFSFTLGSLIRLMLFADFFQKRSSILRVCFAALDREEDRPYSFYLLAIQKIGKLLVINATKLMAPELLRPRRFYAIALLAVALGDGLAEPIGRWIKSPRYRTYSVFKTRGNYRTLAGSGCVYIVVFLLICYFWPSDRPDFYYQLLIVPVVATLLEAFSPKSIDNPTIFAGTLLTLQLIHSSMPQ